MYKTKAKILIVFAFVFFCGINLYGLTGLFHTPVFDYKPSEVTRNTFLNDFTYNLGYRSKTLEIDDYQNSLMAWWIPNVPYIRNIGLESRLERSLIWYEKESLGSWFSEHNVVTAKTELDFKLVRLNLENDIINMFQKEKLPSKLNYSLTYALPLEKRDIGISLFNYTKADGSQIHIISGADDILFQSKYWRKNVGWRLFFEPTPKFRLSYTEADIGFENIPFQDKYRYDLNSQGRARWWQVGSEINQGLELKFDYYANDNTADLDVFEDTGTKMGFIDFKLKDTKYKIQLASQINGYPVKLSYATEILEIINGRLRELGGSGILDLVSGRLYEYDTAMEYRHFLVETGAIWGWKPFVQYTNVKCNGELEEYKVLFLKNFQRLIPIDLKEINYLILGLSTEKHFTPDFSGFFTISQIVPLNVITAQNSQETQDSSDSGSNTSATSTDIVDEGTIWGGLSLKMGLNWFF
ncbi:hypothetical protein ACFLZV_05785 [Candidatus Margulisiibacteriota bacterium]